MNKSVSMTLDPRPENPDNRNRFASRLEREGFGRLRRAPLSTLQINLGRLCNQACGHCHVDAGPKRTEVMTKDTMDRIVAWIGENDITDVDITGGAPEMNPHFRTLVDDCQTHGARVGVRCNLTILVEPGFEDLVNWYAERNIALTCSMPCYSRENVDGQRGKGVYDRSIEGLRRLNHAGYGRDRALPLDLVYNPAGAFLPPAQESLETDYKRELCNRYGIVFDRLLALANLPINRFERYLSNHGQLESYRRTLEDAFNPGTVERLMCRHLLSVDWQGYVFDCDFNQMLDMPLTGHKQRPRLWDIGANELTNHPIAVGGHCFGCTAGAGSSCAGSLL